MKRITAALVLGAASTTSLAFELHLPPSLGNIIHNAANAIVSASCVATPPKPAQPNLWCTLNQDHCAPDPVSAARLFVTAVHGLKVCRCTPGDQQKRPYQIVQGIVPQVCTYSIVGKLACDADVDIYLLCADGLAPTNGSCKSQAMLDQEAAFAAEGLSITRDGNFNIKAIRRGGETIIDYSNYDKFGRPGLVVDADPNDPENAGTVTLGWPADGSPTPDTMIVDGQTIGLRWLDLFTASEVDVGDTKNFLYYWVNGSLATWIARTPRSQTVARWSPVGVPSPPTTINLAPVPPAAAIASVPDTAAAVALPAPGPQPQVGVHEIAPITPGGGLFAVFTVTVGATMLYPLKPSLLDRVFDFARQCFAVSPMPEAREQECEKRLEADEAACETNGAAFALTHKSGKARFLAACRQSAFQRYVKCRQGMDGSDLPALHGVDFSF